MRQRGRFADINHKCASSLLLRRQHTTSPPSPLVMLYFPLHPSPYCSCLHSNCNYQSAAGTVLTSIVVTFTPYIVAPLLPHCPDHPLSLPARTCVCGVERGRAEGNWSIRAWLWLRFHFFPSSARHPALLYILCLFLQPRFAIGCVFCNETVEKKWGTKGECSWGLGGVLIAFFVVVCCTRSAKGARPMGVNSTPHLVVV